MRRFESRVVMTSLCVMICFLLEVQGKEVKVGFGQSKAPFVIEKSGTGLEIDIFREALAYKGHSLSVEHFSNKRLQRVLKDMKTLDAVATVQKDLKDGFHYVANFVVFDNYAISRLEDQLKLKKIADLKGLKVVTWQNAHQDLGAVFKEMFKPLPFAPYKEMYREESSQRRQNIAFWRKSTQVIIIDKTIFLWYQQQLSRVLNTKGAVRYHPIFSGKTYFYAGFRDAQIAKDFSEGLEHLKSTGRYRELYELYTDFSKKKVIDSSSGL